MHSKDGLTELGEQPYHNLAQDILHLHILRVSSAPMLGGMTVPVCPGKSHTPENPPVLGKLGWSIALLVAQVLDLRLSLPS